MRCPIFGRIFHSFNSSYKKIDIRSVDNLKKKLNSASELKKSSVLPNSIILYCKYLKDEIT